MKIAYFINQYPKVSHSFIRREIEALEKQDVDIKRFAVRSDYDELVDSNDQTEFKKTTYINRTSLLSILNTVALKLVKNPWRFFSVFHSAVRLGRNSDRGILNHVFYFIESCILERWLIQNNIEHIHAHFGTNPAAVVYLSHQLGGPPYSFTVHGPEEFDKPTFIGLGEKIQSAAFVVAISSYGRSQLYRWIDYAQWHKVKVVHCGLENEFYTVDSASFYAGKNIVCVGRLCEQKGQLLLVQAVSELIHQGTDIHLTLAGDGPMRADVEALIRAHQLEQNITITGWISSEQVRDEIINSRALVIPSFAEGLPVVIMEAMALRRPVISTYVAGIPELVIPRENGWLVPAGDVDALKMSLIELLSCDDVELARLGESARERVLQRHNIDVEAGKLVKLFQASVSE